MKILHKKDLTQLRKYGEYEYEVVEVCADTGFPHCGVSFPSLDEAIKAFEEKTGVRLVTTSVLSVMRKVV